jgi:hypothetical protein
MIRKLDKRLERLEQGTVPSGYRAGKAAPASLAINGLTDSAAGSTARVEQILDVRQSLSKSG